jgi:hypothetical protein
MEKDEKEMDARGVLAELIAYRESSNPAEDNKKSNLARRLSMAIFLFGILVVMVNHFVVTKSIVIPSEYILLYLIVLLTSLTLMMVSSYLDYSRDKELKSFIKDPTLNILEASDRRLADEIKLYKSLDEYPAEAVIQTRNFLARKRTLVESVSSMFVGILTKVGVLPAVLAVLIMITKVDSGNSFSIVTMVGFVLIGIYIFCFRLIEASVKFDEYRSIISDYVDMRKERQ